MEKVFSGEKGDERLPPILINHEKREKVVRDTTSGSFKHPLFPEEKLVRTPPPPVRRHYQIAVELREYEPTTPLRLREFSLIKTVT